MKGHGATRSAVAVLAALIALVVTVLVTAVIVRDRVDSDVAGSATVTATAVAQRRDLEEVVRLRGVIGGRPLPPLMSSAAGLLTAVSVRPGQVVRAGERLVDVDGQPVLAMPGPSPYWRDLAVGAQGTDVTQLEQFLLDEGFDPGGVDARFTRSTAQAVTAWQRVSGLMADGTFRVAQSAVAPWPARVNQVDAVLGRSTAPDLPLFSLTTVERVVLLGASGRDRPRLNEGLPVRLTAAAGGPALAGTILELADVPTQNEDGTNRFEVVVAVEQDRIDLVDGASIIADVVVQAATDAVAIPVTAIGTNRAGRLVVAIVDDDQDRQVPVELGMQQEGLIEVKTGVAPGDVVRVGRG